MTAQVFVLGKASIVALVAAVSIIGFTIGFAWWEKKNGRNQ